MIRYCSLIFVDIFVDDTARTVQIYQALIYQCIVAMFCTQPTTAKELGISNMTIMIFSQKNFFAKTRIIVVPNSEFFYKITQENQEKAGFHLEDEYDYLCLNNKKICSFGTLKVFRIEYDKSLVEVFPKDIQIFEPDARQSPIRIKVVELNNFLVFGTICLNLTDMETGTKYPFHVKSARSSGTFEPDFKFILVSLGVFIQLFVNFFVSHLTLTEQSRVTFMSMIIVWALSILPIYYYSNEKLMTVISEIFYGKWISFGIVLSFALVIIRDTENTELNKFQKFHISFSVIIIFCYLSNIIDNNKCSSHFGIIFTLSKYFYNFTKY